MRKIGSPRHGNCVYCGRTTLITRDHIPPKTLFSRPRPNSLITVPSCNECNKSFEKDDEYFQLALSLREDTAQHPDALDRWQNAIESLSRPERLGYRNAFAKKVTQVNRVTKSGLYVGKSLALLVEQKRIHRVIDRIVKGLFFHEKHFRLSDEYDVRSFTKKTSSAHEHLLNQQRRVNVGNNVFSYAFLSSDDIYVTEWSLLFYGQVQFIAFTLKKSDIAIRKKLITL